MVLILILASTVLVLGICGITYWISNRFELWLLGGKQEAKKRD